MLQTISDKRLTVYQSQCCMVYRPHTGASRRPFSKCLLPVSHGKSPLSANPLRRAWQHAVPLV